MDKLQSNKGSNQPPQEQHYFHSGALSRREFLELAGAAGAGAAAAYWANRYPQSAVGWPWNSLPAQAKEELDLAAAVIIYAGDDIQVAVNEHPENTVFLLKAVDRDGRRAIHRLQQIVPKDGQQFIGERDANNELITVMNGADVLPADRWVQDGEYYRYDAQVYELRQLGRRVVAGRSFAEGWYAACAQPEDLFITTPGWTRFLKRVRTKEEVVENESWYLDQGGAGPVRDGVELIQPWISQEQSALRAYGWNGLEMMTRSDDIPELPPAEQHVHPDDVWLAADVDGDGKDELIRLGRNEVEENGEIRGRLSLIVFGGDGRRMVRKWGSENMQQGPVALAWLVADVDGDGRDELLQLWANDQAEENGRTVTRLGLIVYYWQDGAMRVWGTSNIGEPPGALAWLTGDVDGDGQDELLQPWDNGGRLGLRVYGWDGSQMTARPGTSNTGEGSEAQAWLVGDIDDDGQVELLQPYSNSENGKLGVLVYGWKEGRMQRIAVNADAGADPDPLAWFVADVDGDGQDDLLKLWVYRDEDEVEWLAIIVYGWKEGQVKRKWGSNTVQRDPAALAWLVADIDGDGKEELLQPYAKDIMVDEMLQENVALRTYGWYGDGMVAKSNNNNLWQGPLPYPYPEQIPWLVADVYDSYQLSAYIRNSPRAKHPGQQEPIIELSMAKYAFGYHVDQSGPYTPEWPKCEPPAGGPPCWSGDCWCAGEDFWLNCLDPRPLGNHPDIYDAADLYHAKPANVVIRDLIIEKYACPAQTGAIGYFRPGNDWTISGNEVRYNHGSGIKFKGRAVVRGNYVHHNGQFGIETGDGNRESWHGGDINRGLEEWGFNGGFSGVGSLVEANVIESNNFLDFDPGWGAGGTKFSQCYDLTVRDNLVRNNNGPGLWTDFAYVGTLYEGNVVINNNGPGIFHEISFDAAIRDNFLAGNAIGYGERGSGLPYSSQLYLSSSSYIDATSNTIICSPSGDSHGIIVMQFAYGSEKTRTIEGYPVYCDSIRILRNAITSEVSERGFSGGVVTYCSERFFAPGNIVFNENTYHLRSPNWTHWYWNKKKLTFTEFKAKGHEKNSNQPDAETSQPLSGNRVRNFSFADGKEPWKFHHDGPYAGFFSVVSAPDPFDGEESAEVALYLPADDIQLYQDGIELRPNTTYELSFAARSSDGTDMSVWIYPHGQTQGDKHHTSFLPLIAGAAQTSDGSYLNDFHVPLQRHWKYFTVTFRTPQRSSISKARLRFWFAPFARSEQIKVFIDQVVVRAVDEPCAYYVGSDKHIHELALNAYLDLEKAQWQCVDVTTEAGGLPSYEEGPLVVTTYNTDPRVYYVGTDRHIHELAWLSFPDPKKAKWQHRDLTDEAGGPLAYSLYPGLAVMSYTREPRLYYVGSDLHIHELAWMSYLDPQNAHWYHRDISAEAGGYPADGTTAVAVTSYNTEPRIYYVGDDAHIHELAWMSYRDLANAKWYHRDLSGEAIGSPAYVALPRGSLAVTSYITEPRVYYAGNDGHVHELAWMSYRDPANAKWFHRNLTDEVGFEPIRIHYKRALGKLGVTTYNTEPRVYFVAYDQHIHELAWMSHLDPANAKWFYRDLSAETGAALAEAGFYSRGLGVMSTNLEPRIYYVGDDAHIHELAWMSYCDPANAQWYYRDLSELAAGKKAQAWSMIASIVETTTR